MNALLTDSTKAKPPWTGLRPGRAGLLNTVQKSLSALLARHLRRVEAQLMNFDAPMFSKRRRPQGAAESFSRACALRISASVVETARIFSAASQADLNEKSF